MTGTASNRPNFVFINTDQQRTDTLGCYGSAVARTPNIDQLASEGVRFNRCFTTHPVCMPARASWWTGQYPSHHGVWQNGVPLHPHADTLQAALKRGGYRTAVVGKLHLDTICNRKTRNHPLYGFDSLIECEGDPCCYDDYFHWLREKGLFEDYMQQREKGGHQAGYTSGLSESSHMNNWVTDCAERHLEERVRDGLPFFLSIGYFDPHFPFDPCEPYASMFDPEDMPMPIYQAGEESGMTPLARERFDQCAKATLDPTIIRTTIAAYHAMVAHVDAMVGRILQTLHRLGIEDNTVVIFGSDHGEMLGDHGILYKGPLFYDGAISIPLIYRLPRKWQIGGTISDQFVSNADLAPTVAALANVQAPHGVQGRPLFNGESHQLCDLNRQAAVVQWRQKPFQSDEQFTIARCLVTDRWKYVYFHGRDFGELYDRAADPGEHHNRFADRRFAGVRADLHDQLVASMFEMDVTPPRTNWY
jgi:arylsulfatase